MVVPHTQQLQHGAFAASLLRQAAHVYMALSEASQEESSGNEATEATETAAAAAAWGNADAERAVNRLARAFEL